MSTNGSAPRHVSRAHGLTIATPYALATPGQGVPDLEVVRGPDRRVPADPAPLPPGEVLADLVDPARRVRYAFLRLEDGSYLLRWPGAVEIALNADATRAVGVVDPDVDPGLLEVLTKGALLAFVLLIRGEALLHASAVEHDGRAVGLVGASGMGKSTLATMLCAGGARLLTDDVLRLELRADAVAAHRGVAETRLRPAAAELADLFGPDQRTETADGRQALRLEPSPLEELPLDLLVVPQPRRDLTEMTAVRVPPLEAMLLLSRFPRFPGWKDKAELARQFQHLGELVERVPVVLLRVPWGPPFAALSPDDVLAAAIANS